MENVKISLVTYFDLWGRVRLHVKFVMHEAKYLARLERVWLKSCRSSAAGIIMWSMIWHCLKQYWHTLTKTNGRISDKKPPGADILMDVL